MADVIYKLCAAHEWEEARGRGRYEGSADDRRDGFIHFSGRDQVTATVARHFAGRRDLVLVAVAADRLGADLRWEPSRGGALFPHLYGPLPVSAAIEVTPLTIDAEGLHVLPVGSPTEAR
jgi:uncharacterized protein (DUF952 family)